MSKPSAKCVRCGAALEVEAAAGPRGICPHCGAPQAGVGAARRAGPRLAVLLGLLGASLVAWAIVRPGRPPATQAPRPLEPPRPELHPRDPFGRTSLPAPPERPLPPLDTPSADAEAGPPKLFQGVVRALADGRVEFFYDFAAPAELRNWRYEGTGQPTVADGEVRFGGPEGRWMIFVAPFTGDIDIAGTWRQDVSIVPAGDCNVSFCCLDEGHRYAASLTPGSTWIFKNDGYHEVRRKNWDCAAKKEHKFRVERAGEAIRVWVDEQIQVEAKDGEYTRGTVCVGSWNSHIAIGEIRITGRPDPNWLARNARAKEEIEAARKPAGK